MPEDAAVCSLLWQGRARDARRLFGARIVGRHPDQAVALYELVLRALEGDPWRIDNVDVPATTVTHYDRALLHMLRGEQHAADTLCRERYEDRRRVSGSGRQRFSPYFPGALIAALGPPDTEPDVDWLLGWIHDPPFPGLWVVHRAICALLLSERAEPPEPGLADHAIRLLGFADADDSVLAWIGARAESGPRRDGGV
jgi:hypothetical protein